MARLTPGLRWQYRRLRSYLGRPKLVLQEKPVIIDERSLCERPIFLIGVHRSGTSLMRRIINSHSHIACPPETFYLCHFAAMIEDPLTFAGFSGLGYDRDAALVEIRKLASRYHEAFRLSQNKPRWADKTPQHTAILNQLRLLFGDQTQFLMIYRHPFDITYSIYRRGWHFGDYSSDIFENTVVYVAECLEKQLEFFSHHPEICHTIIYEHLAQSPEHVLQGVFNFLDEPWEAEVLNFHTKEHNFGVEDPFIRGTRGFELSYGNWAALSTEQHDVASRHLGSLAESLGYTLDPTTPPKC